jgi:hypothetical protein
MVDAFMSGKRDQIAADSVALGSKANLLVKLLLFSRKLPIGSSLTICSRVDIGFV